MRIWIRIHNAGTEVSDQGRIHAWEDMEDQAFCAVDGTGFIPPPPVKVAFYNPGS